MNIKDQVYNAIIPHYKAALNHCGLMGEESIAGIAQILKGHSYLRVMFHFGEKFNSRLPKNVIDVSDIFLVESIDIRSEVRGNKGNYRELALEALVSVFREHLPNKAFEEFHTRLAGTKRIDIYSTPEWLSVTLFEPIDKVVYSNGHYAIKFSNDSDEQDLDKETLENADDGYTSLYMNA